VRVIEYNTKEKGQIYARIKGFEEVRGDIIACIDGDSYASPKWLEKITKPLLQNEKIAGVGGFVWFNGLFANLASISFFFLDRIFRPTHRFYFWGANFAVKKSAYDAVGGFIPLIALKEKLKLHLMPDDAYLSCALMKVGDIKFVPNACVHSDDNFLGMKNKVSKSSSAKATADAFVPKLKGDMQNEDRLALFRYFHLIK